jgi:Polyketide cyclase / dehydrase and lipid transport
MRPALLLLSFVLAVLAPGLGRSQDAPTVKVGGAGASITADATIRIHASREVIWAIISSCPEALKIVPSLKDCEVLERAPDGSWVRIRQVMEYFRFLPDVKFEVKVNYLPPGSVTFARISGDLTSLRGEWILQSDGDYTNAHYDIAIEPGRWVPNWIVRAALKHDLPKMLQALRSNAESIPAANLG